MGKGKKRKTTTKNQMTKKPKKPKPEPTPLDKLAKLESQMIKRILDMEKLEKKCVKKLAKAAKKAKDSDLQYCRCKFRKMEKDLTKDPEESERIRKLDRPAVMKKVEMLKAIIQSAKNVTPESIAELVFKDLPKPTIKLPRSEVGELHRKRQQEEAPENLPSPPAATAIPSKPVEPQKTAEQQKQAKEESNQESSDEESSEEEESEDESSDEEGEGGSKGGSKEEVKKGDDVPKEAAPEVLLAVVEDKGSLRPYSQRIIEKDDFQVRLKDMDRVLRIASNKSETFVKRQETERAKALEEAKASGVDPQRLVIPDYTPAVAFKFNPRGKLGKKAMKAERKYKARVQAKRDREALGQKRKAERAAAQGQAPPSSGNANKKQKTGA